MKVLFISSYFPPEIGPAASRMGVFAKYLSSKGVNVEVLTCNPRYPRGFKFENFDGMQGSYFSHGAKVLVFHVPDAKFNVHQRITEEVRFYTRGIKLWKSLQHPDLVIGTSPFFSAACLGFSLALKFNVPFIYDIRDLYPENLRIAELPLPSILYRYIDGWARRMYQGASKIVVNQPNLYKILQNELQGKPIELVMNPVDVPLQSFVRRLPASEDKLTVGYAGLWGRGYDFKTYLEVVRRANPKLFKFRLIGSGAWRPLVENFYANSPSNFSVHFGWMERERLLQEYSKWHISLVHEYPAWTRTMWPAKIPELLAHGIAVIVPAELLIPNELEDISLLIRARSSNAEGYLEALDKARDVVLNTPTDEVIRQRRKVLELFDPQRLGEKYHQIIQEVIG